MSRRILHAIAPAPTGGAERVVQMLAAAQRGRGDAPLVVGTTSPAPGEHPFFVPLARDGVEHRRIAIPDRAYAREVRELGRLIASWAPEVVHTHGYRSDVVAGLAAWRARVPLVSTAHGFIGGDRRGRVYERVQIASYRLGREVIAVSDPIAGRLRRGGVPSGRVHLVPNALRPPTRLAGRDEARVRLGIAAETWTVGWVGRLGHEKGPDVALEALSSLDDVRLSFIGEGEMARELAARADALGLSSRVTFHGAIEEAARWLAAFDAVASSSRTEGTPITLLEAMHAGVPIVAARVGGVPELLEDGAHALLVEPERPDLLAAALERLRTEPGLGAALAAAAAARVADAYGETAWLDRHDAVYDAAGGGR